jgi:uncharacterized repeat protein (TIGR01451 family)
LSKYSAVILSSHKVSVGENVTVTVTAENFAENSTTGFDVVLKDSLPSGITLVSGSLNDNDFGDLEEEESRSNTYTIVADQPGHYTLPSARLEYDSINGDDLTDESIPVELTVLYGQLSLQVDVTAPKIIDKSGMAISATVLDIDGVTHVQDASVYALVEREGSGVWQAAYTIPMGWSQSSQSYIGVTPVIESKGNYRVTIKAQKDLYDDGQSSQAVFYVHEPEPDITGDGKVNLLDFSVLANKWMLADCSDLNNWCDKADIDHSGNVGIDDLLIMAEHWMDCLFEINPDFTGEGKVNLADFSVFAAQWDNQNCVEPDWCNGADLNRTGSVGMDDLLIFAEHWLEGTSAALSNRIAIINPDSHRILKCGVVYNDNTYVSVANGSHEDGDTLLGNPALWSGVGQQTDFIGSILTAAGCQVDYFEASQMPAISKMDYGIVIVQDPLRTNVATFDKATVDTGNLPDLLQHVTDNGFIGKIDNYIQSGGNVVLIGDAVRLLENGSNRLNYGKSITAISPPRTVNQVSSWIPGQWLFVRGNPFCGADRNGSGTYSVVAGDLAPVGSSLATVSLNNRSDLPYSHVWSDTIYKPADSVSLLTVKFQGQGDYVLDGSTCSPTVYHDTVDVDVPGFVGYTESNGKRIYCIGSDSFFDYDFQDWHGTWHTGQSMEIRNTVSSSGKNMIIALVNRIFSNVGSDYVIAPLP